MSKLMTFMCFLIVLLIEFDFLKLALPIIGMILIT